MVKLFSQVFKIKDVTEDDQPRKLCSGRKIQEKMFQHALRDNSGVTDNE